MSKFLKPLIGWWRFGWKFRIGIFIILFFVLLAIFHTPVNNLIGHGSDPTAPASFPAWQQPSAEHWLGTDRYGRDILALVIQGLSASLTVGFVAGVVGTVIGVFVAFLAGYKGGLLDTGLTGFSDLMLVIPTFPLMIVLSAYSKGLSLVGVGILVAVIGGWAGSARRMRSMVLSLRARPYVELAKVTRLRDVEIIMQELMPNLMPYIALGFANAVLGGMFALVGLEVIGLGPANVVDLGLILNQALTWGAMTLGFWPMFVAPILVLTALFFAVNLINIGLEERFNPRLRKTAGS